MGPCAFSMSMVKGDFIRIAPQFSKNIVPEQGMFYFALGDLSSTFKEGYINWA